MQSDTNTAYNKETKQFTTYVHNISISNLLIINLHLHGTAKLVAKGYWWGLQIKQTELVNLDSFTNGTSGGGGQLMVDSTINQTN